MAMVLLITPSTAGDPFPALGALRHTLVVRAPKDQVLATSADADIVVIDARTDLVAAKNVCQMFKTAGVVVPRLVILAERDLGAFSADWGCADFCVGSAVPAELDTRLRVLMAPEADQSPRVLVGGLVIDEAAYSVWLDNEPLDLTFTEFELLRFLATHPGRVFSRKQLLAEVWGFDYYGGPRTVDVHVRRLRAKLGPEYESLIGTVRNVGYRFTDK